MRTRLQIILDHATLHKLTAEQLHELVRLLPDYHTREQQIAERGGMSEEMADCYGPTAQIIPLHPAARRDKAAG